MSRWRWALLIFELVLFAVILILPQVELPDFTFHSGTAPVVMKTRLDCGVARTSLIIPAPIQESLPVVERRWEPEDIQPVTDQDTRLSLLCTLTC